MMTTTLVVIVFPNQDRAEDVFRALSAMRRRELYGLQDSLMVKRVGDSPGNEIVTMRLVDGVPGDAGAGVLRSVAGLILASVDGALDDTRRAGLNTAGLDLHFIEAIAVAFADEFSALFFLVDADSIGDAVELGNVLSLFRGQIARTTLTAQALAYLENPE